MGEVVLPSSVGRYLGNPPPEEELDDDLNMRMRDAMNGLREAVQELQRVLLEQERARVLSEQERASSRPFRKITQILVPIASYSVRTTAAAGRGIMAFVGVVARIGVNVGGRAGAWLKRHFHLF